MVFFGKVVKGKPLIIDQTGRKLPLKLVVGLMDRVEEIQPEMKKGDDNELLH